MTFPCHCGCYGQHEHVSTCGCYGQHEHVSTCDAPAEPPCLHRLLSVVTGLGEDEIAVLCAIADRLALGRQRYGELRLESDRRDWKRELIEELLDACVYAACAEITKEEK